MTIDDIKALIAAKISGQGDAVDAGGALPTILEGLADAIKNIPTGLPVLDITDLGDMRTMVEISVERAEAIRDANAVRYVLDGAILEDLRILDIHLNGILGAHAKASGWNIDEVIASFGSYSIDDGAIDESNCLIAGFTSTGGFVGYLES